ncbi:MULTISPECIES: ATP-binding protein [unclassified Halomonas]|jgi:SpoVK/Ycf46/Vps4 family AAA+-type ATPase|uniref:AAA family ATPase n=1 Tax=unclassified Halomonas TaxID=2609666 RepID=UPI0007848206|nr:MULTISPECIES: ATP-binding protein [unclassified Halomonas]MCO7242768.1 ATP-binding protein [Halomonas sp. Ps84H-12]
MASANQLKALLQSHLEGNDSRFYSVAMQVAAHEAKLGHGKLAEEIRSLVDQAKSRRHIASEGKTVPISKPRGELANLLSVSYPKSRLVDMVLDEDLEQQLHRIIREQKHAAEILSHGLQPRRKILLVGPPGTGKTMTASVLAGELGLPLFQVRLDGLITKFMGETAAKLRQIFESTHQTRGVYFFDEFDAIGSQRGLANDVGEVRRILNSFLQMIEQDDSHSLIIGATNHPDILDNALFRRFDDLLHYELPDEVHIASILKSRLHRLAVKNTSWKRLASKALGLSYAELARAADEVLKTALIERAEKIHEKDISHALEERRQLSNRLNKIS